MALPNPTGSFAPTTFVLDVAQIDQIDVNSAEFKELLVRLYQNLNRICLVLNTKSGGYYSVFPFVTGNIYFPNVAGTGIAASLSSSEFRPSTRIVINFGALPNNTTKSVAHGLSVTSNTTWVVIYGTATDPNGLIGIPIPYASATTADIVELYVDATNVNVITNGNLTNYTTTIIVLEFLNS